MRLRISDKGSALVEAAAIIPLILLLSLGVIDVARAFFESAKVQEAAQEGAYYASLNPVDPSEAIARAEDAIQVPDFTGTVTVTCPTQDQVTVVHTFNIITPIASNIIGNTIDLTHAQTARVLTADACSPSP